MLPDYLKPIEQQNIFRANYEAGYWWPYQQQYQRFHLPEDWGIGLEEQLVLLIDHRN